MHTGIEAHLRGLDSRDIAAATRRPTVDEPPLLHVVSEFDAIVERALQWTEGGEDCMMSFAVRYALNSFNTDEVAGRRSMSYFRTHKARATLERYFDHWRRFLSYVGRLRENPDALFPATGPDCASPASVVAFDADAAKHWNAVHAEALEALDPPIGLAAVSEDLERLCYRLIVQPIDRMPMQCPLVSFAAQMAYKSQTSLAWHEAHNFNSILSGLVWVAQLLLFYHAAAEERRGRGRVEATVARLSRDVLKPDAGTAIGELLRWRSYLFAVAKNTVTAHTALWDESEQVLTYAATRLCLGEIPRLLRLEYQRCAEVLYEDLLLGLPGLSVAAQSALADNGASTHRGYYFLDHPDNAALAASSATAVVRRIVRSPQHRACFLTSRAATGASLQWNGDEIARYEASVQVFLSHLCVLIHFSSGQPVRAPEFLSMTWQNTQRGRAIVLMPGRGVMIHIQYHKGQHLTDSYKENIRFLAAPIARLLLDYLIFVQPVRLAHLRQARPGATLSPYLWERGGEVWHDDRLSRCMRAACKTARLPDLHVENWRQMTVAIVKTKFAADADLFPHDGSERDDDGREGIDPAVAFMAVQRNHSIRTSNRAYANNHHVSHRGGLWDGLVRQGFAASMLWQQFWGVDAVCQRPGRSTPRLTSSAAESTALAQRQVTPVWTETELLQAAAQIARKAVVGWTSEAQGRAVRAVFAREPQLVVILPPGAGKSMLFLLPAAMPYSGCTVLILPLVALRTDMVRRLQESSVDYVVWTPDCVGDARLVLVTVEAAGSSSFVAYAQRLLSQQRLDRLVFDECHLIITSAEYRSSMARLRVLCELPVPVVFLSATLPPLYWAEFLRRNHLVGPALIREACHRPNLCYCVVRRPDAIRDIASVVSGYAARVHREPAGRGLIYVRTRAEADQVRAALQCHLYTGEQDGDVDRAWSLRDWSRGEGSRWLVATTALAEGLDYPSIRTVLHIGPPDSLLTWAQQAGRGGRDGRSGMAAIVLDPEWQRLPADETPLVSTSEDDPTIREDQERRFMDRFLRHGSCLRTVLSEALDEPEDRRHCSPRDKPCGFCWEHGLVPVRGEPSAPQHGASSALEVRLEAGRARDARDQADLARYRAALEGVRGICVYCRILGEPRWDHILDRCPYYGRFLDVKRTVEGKPWLPRYTACFTCYQPQFVCPRAIPGNTGGRCEYKDVVLPLCLARWATAAGKAWYRQVLHRTFSQPVDLMSWLGRKIQWGGGDAIQAVRVAARLLNEMNGGGAEGLVAWDF
jgi:superfamily II DNA or RNA helicase